MTPFPGLPKGSRSLLSMVLLACLAALLSACGGGGGGGGSSAAASTTPLTGVFADAPVDGVDYKTATQSGTTSNGGQFKYLGGETVAFSIGNTPLGVGAAAKAIVTPVDLVIGASDQTHPTVTNIVQLILSSADDSTAPTLNISPTTKAALKAAAAIDVTQAQASFATKVESAIGKAPVTSTAAQSHMASTLAKMAAANGTCADFSGTWSNVQGSKTGGCDYGSAVAQIPANTSMAVQQSGCSVAFTDAAGHLFQGAAVGNEADMKSSYSEAGYTTNETAHFVLSGNVLSGNTAWQWTSPQNCPAGSTTITAATRTTPVAGTCGSSGGSTLSTAPTTNLCATGTKSGVTGSGPWNWSCQGAHGGTTASCSAYLYTVAVAGSCGSSNGGTTSSAPAANTLCSAGTASSVSGSGPWTWSCQGTSGGTTASCSANKSSSQGGGTVATATTLAACKSASGYWHQQLTHCSAANEWIIKGYVDETVLGDTTSEVFSVTFDYGLAKSIYTTSDGLKFMEANYKLVTQDTIGVKPYVSWQTYEAYPGGTLNFTTQKSGTMQFYTKSTGSHTFYLDSPTSLSTLDKSGDQAFVQDFVNHFIAMRDNSFAYFSFSNNQQDQTIYKLTGNKCYFGNGQTSGQFCNNLQVILSIPQ